MSRLPERPLYPFDEWPIHVRDEVGQFFVWYTQPTTIVTQAFWEDMSVLNVHRLIAAVDALRHSRAEQARSGESFLLIHDWSGINSVSSPARDELSAAWRRNLKRGDLRGVSNALPHMDKTFNRMAFSAVNVVAQLITGVEMKHMDDVAAELAAQRILPPRADEDMSAVIEALAALD